MHNVFFIHGFYNSWIIYSLIVIFRRTNGWLMEYILWNTLFNVYVIIWNTRQLFIKWINCLSNKSLVFFYIKTTINKWFIRKLLLTQIIKVCPTIVHITTYSRCLTKYAQTKLYIIFIYILQNCFLRFKSPHA